MSEKQLIHRVQEVLGDTDTVLAVAFFEPRGTSGGIIGGNEAGSDVGRLVGGNLGELVGGVAGTVIGLGHARDHGGFGSPTADGATVHRVPWASMIAVTPTRLLGWRVTMKGGHRVPGEPIFSFDRHDVAITVHSRVTVRTFEIHDLLQNEKWEFEANRLGGHLKFVLDALHDDPPEEGA